MFPIIQARPEYLSDIYKMILELARHDGFEDKVKITESELSNLLFCYQHNHFVGMVLINGKLVGLVMYNFTDHNVCVNVTRGIYIENLYVSPAFRKQGIGTSLFNYIVRKALVNGCSRIEWWVSGDNKKAANFYKRMGAVELTDWCIYKFDKTAMNKLLTGKSDEDVSSN